MLLTSKKTSSKSDYRGDDVTYRAKFGTGASIRRFAVVRGPARALRCRSLVLRGDRSALILATLKRHPGWGLVARDASGRTKGYLVRSVSKTGTRIGPFMASKPEDARALLSLALVVSGNVSVEISVPDSGQAHAILEEFGFTGRVDRLRMELGEAPGAEGLQAYGTTPIWLLKDSELRYTDIP